MDFGVITIIPIQNSLVEKAQWSTLTYYLSNHDQFRLSLDILWQIKDGHKWVFFVLSFKELGPCLLPLNMGELCDHSDQQSIAQVKMYPFLDPSLKRLGAAISHLLGCSFLKPSDHARGSPSNLVKKPMWRITLS